MVNIKFKRIILKNNCIRKKKLLKEFSKKKCEQFNESGIFLIKKENSQKKERF
jgi:hypothetical protein